MKKRIASLLLALPLCLTLLPTTALAEDEAASDRTVIATVEDLQQFARAVDAGDYDGKTDAVVELAADLDLTGIEWTPIGSTVNADGEVEHCFSGKFYGNGHTVSNLDLSDVYGATVLCGFFGDIENAEISSLTVQGTINVNSEREYTYYGAIAGFAGGCTIFDCTADVSFTNNENLVYGMIGLCGQASDTVIDYCRNTGDLLLTGDAGSLYAGGIVGFADGDSEIRYCVNTGELSLAASHGGGIAGQLAGNAKVINCYATGKLTPYGKGTEDLGGIVGTAGGSAGSAAIQHCYFAGEMDMSQYTASAPYGRLGAIAGSAKETTAFENNYYAESNEVTACGKGVEAGKARTYEAMCSEDFYNELTAGGGQYQYNTPSTPVLPAPKYMVTFVVAPADMTNVVITVNGEPVEENAELEAGIYTVTVAADNCETVNVPIRNYIVDGNISDGCTAWGVHNGTYTVPAGQYVSRFFFVAVASASGDSEEGLKRGNLIDRVWFSTDPVPPAVGSGILRVTKTLLKTDGTALTDAELIQAKENLHFTVVNSDRQIVGDFSGSTMQADSHRPAHRRGALPGTGRPVLAGLAAAALQGGVTHAAGRPSDH